MTEPISDGHVERDDVADIVARAVRDVGRRTSMVTIRVAREPEGISAVRRAAAWLDAAGFVPIRAGDDRVDDRQGVLAHRHVAILACSPGDDRALIVWLQRLAAVSVRAHLVVRFVTADGADAASTATVVRERAPDWRLSPFRVERPDARMRRAGGFDRRGRAAQAERWYRAALESARRRGDDHAQAHACRRLVALMHRRDDWDAACRLARVVLNGLRVTGARAEVAAALIDALIARAELGQAEALLSIVAIELDVSGCPPPSSLEDARAQLKFWQGQLDEMAAIPPTPRSPSRLVIDAAVAFLRRDTRALGRSLDDAASLDTDVRRLLEPLFGVLQASIAKDHHRLRASVAGLGRPRPASGCPRLARLASVLTAEAFVVAGLSPPDATVTALADAPEFPPFDRLLLDWQRAMLARDRDRKRAAALALVRVGARVVESWRWGCSDMHLVHAIPVVLELVQAAEDELAALVAACGWIRRTAGAEAVAFLDLYGTTLAGDGWTVEDTADVGVESLDGRMRVRDARAGGLVVARDVRYAGSVTGVLAARAPADRREAIVEAIATVAALCGAALRARVDLARTMRGSPSLSNEILGRSSAIVTLREAVARAAVTPFPVLIEGESGTGKELVARAAHRLSPRRDRRFVAVNCAALTDELVEAELFGHARGAFTGALGPRAGLIEEAHGGSLFLDEVSELSPRAQAKLLRVLQEREVRRVGENAPRAVDARVIAATNRPLAAAVKDGAFREDLLFRLAVVRLHVPPLRDRVEDVPILAHAFWRSLAAETGKRAVLGPDAVAALCRHPWPGNVRELQNAMAALVVTAPDRGRVGARHVGQVLAAGTGEPATPARPLHRARADMERSAVAGALARHGGRRTAAARELGLTRQGLSKAMKRLGLATREKGPETGVA